MPQPDPSLFTFTTYEWDLLDEAYVDKFNGMMGQLGQMGSELSTYMLEIQAASDDNLSAVVVLKDQSEAAAERAESAASDAAAVVSGGTASLSPEPGKIPIAGASSMIDGGWIGDVAARGGSLLSDGGNVVAIVNIDVSQDSDPTWNFKCQHLDWWSETKPPGKFLGVHASSADAAAVSGAAIDDWWMEAGSVRFYKLTDILSPASEITFRAGSNHFPLRAIAKVLDERFVICDVTSGEPLSWIGRVSGVGGFTCADYLDGVLVLGQASDSSTEDGVWVLDFKRGRSTHITSNSSSVHHGWNPGIDLTQGVGVHDSAMPVLIGDQVNSVKLVRQYNGDLILYAGTDEGLSRIENLTTNPSGTSWEDSSGGGYDYMGPIVSLGDQLLATSNTGPSSLQVLAFDVGDDLADSHYDTGAGVYYSGGAIEVNRLNINPTIGISSTINAVAATARDLIFGMALGAVRVLHNAGAIRESLKDIISATFRTGFVQGDASVLGCDNDSASVSDTELMSNGDFSSGTDSWNGASYTDLTESGGVLRATNSVGGGSPGRTAQTITTVADKWHLVLVDVGALSGFTHVNLYASDGNTLAYSSAIASESDVSASSIAPLVFKAVSAETSIIVSGHNSTDGNWFELNSVSTKRIAYDLTGNERHMKAAAGGTVSKVLSPGGGIYGFTGFNLSGNHMESIDIGNDPDIKAGAFFSAVVDVTGSNTYDVILGNYSGVDDTGFVISNNATGELALTFKDDTGTTRSIDSTVSEDGLHQVAAYLADGDQRFYVNGQLIGSAAYTLAAPTEVLKLGVQISAGPTLVGSWDGGGIFLVKQLDSNPSYNAIKAMAISDIAIVKTGGLLTGNGDVVDTDYDPHSDLVVYLQSDGTVDYFSAETGARVKTLDASSVGTPATVGLYDGELFVGGDLDTYRSAEARPVGRLPAVTQIGLVGFDPGDADASGVYWLPKGHKPKRIHIDGAVGEPDHNGTVRDYTTTHNGFLHGVDPNGVVSSRLVVETEVPA